MRALVIDRLGPPDTLRIADLPVAEPGPGQVRVRVAAVGVNPADWKILERGWPSWMFPVVAGLDGAGVVEAAGPDVAHVAPGDRVYWHGRFPRLGAYAERPLIDADLVVGLPPAVRFDIAAALPTAGFTAYQITEVRTRPAAGDTAVVNAAAGGVGLYAMQLLKRRGVRVIAIASAGNRAFVEGHGADVVLDYRAADLPAAIRATTGGRGADLIIDPMGPESAGRMLGLLAYGGHLVCVTGVPTAADLARFPRGVSVHDISLNGAYSSGEARAMQQVTTIAREVAALVAAGALKVPLERRVAFDDLPAALVENKGGHQRGRVVGLVDAALAAGG